MDWKKLDEIKRRLFGRLRDEVSFDYLKVGFEEYRERFKRIPDRLLEEWQSIEREHKDHPDLYRFKGALYEVLFYYACLDYQAFFFDAELAEFGGQRFDQSPPWFVSIPLYDIIPQLHRTWENGNWKRKVPQVDADFILSYVDDKGPSPPVLIDVKSSEPIFDERFGWQCSSDENGIHFPSCLPKTGCRVPTGAKRLGDANTLWKM